MTQEEIEKHEKEIELFLQNVIDDLVYKLKNNKEEVKVEHKFYEHSSDLYITYNVNNYILEFSSDIDSDAVDIEGSLTFKNGDKRLLSIEIVFNKDNKIKYFDSYDYFSKNIFVLNTDGLEKELNKELEEVKKHKKEHILKRSIKNFTKIKEVANGK